MLPLAISQAYQASLEKNEGRHLKFALLLEHETYKSSATTRFHEPKPLDSMQLQSISAAFDPGESCLVVEHTNSQPFNLQIIGIAVRPFPELRLSTEWPPAIIVEAEAPGLISLEIGSLKAVFDKGVIRIANKKSLEELPLNSSLPMKAITPTRFQPALRLGLQEVIDINEENWQNHKQEYEQLVSDHWPRLLSSAIESLIKKTRIKCHGGGFIFVPGDYSHVLKPSSGVWFKENCQVLTHWLLRTLSIQGLFTLGLRGKFVTSGLDSFWQSNPQQWAKDILSSTFRDTLLNLDNAYATCAHLSEADGVTVLNHDFEILAFSVSIERIDLELPNDWVEYLKTRGNRHRSMANAIAALEGSVGIVISQDGYVTIFINRDGSNKSLLNLTL